MIIAKFKGTPGYLYQRFYLFFFKSSNNSIFYLFFLVIFLSVVLSKYIKHVDLSWIHYVHLKFYFILSITFVDLEMTI